MSGSQAGQPFDDRGGGAQHVALLFWLFILVLKIEPIQFLNPL
jgi:hypothetical protein